MINLMEDKKNIEESEADEFALNATLPNADWKSSWQGLVMLYLIK